MKQFIPKHPEIYWVGAIDWSVRNFHGYTTDYGSTYNSYLIDDQSPTIIDTVKAPFFNEYISRITKYVQLDAIKYLVILHAEPDHSSCLPLIYQYLSNCTIVTNKLCHRLLIMLYPSLEFAKFEIIDAHSELKIGHRVLKFIMTPYVHWPEQMMCYDAYDEILFSSDGFGQHYASSERWADQIDRQQLLYLQKEYLANIVGPYKQQIGQAIDKLRNYKISYILPAHGLGFRPNDKLTKIDYIQIYRDYADETHLQKKIVIMFDTMYGQSARVANSFSEGVQKAGYSTIILDLKVTSLTKVATECIDCCGVCVICATFALHPMPNVYRALHYVQGLQLLQNKQACCAVGYGWSSCHGKVLELLDACKADVQRDKLQFTNRCTEKFLCDIYEYSNYFAERCMM